MPDDEKARQEPPPSDKRDEKRAKPRTGGSALSEIKGRPGGLGQAGTANREDEDVAGGYDGGGIDGAIGGGHSGQGGG